jgi:hypothetical protein
MPSLSRDAGRPLSRPALAWCIRALLLAAMATVSLVATTASAAPRDKAALKKIDEALTTHYLNMDFDAAEGVLVGTIRACEDKCSGSVIAKAWMYVGIVKGAGRNDLGAALDAFKKAIAADPGVQLDDQVATEQVKATFAKAKGGGGGGGGAVTTPTPSGGGGEGFTCTPVPGTEVETRRPIPVSCEADADLKGAKLHFKAFGGQWTTLKMEPNAGVYRAMIPCSATQSTGKLRIYVEGLDNDNDVAVKLGSKDNPKVIEVVSETTAEPPAYPDEEPPARCGIGEGDGGSGGACGGWGGKCGPNNCCETGLACVAGTCEASQCESDSDCKNGGTCEKGKCTGGEGGEGEGDGKSAPYKKNWIGLHFGLDLASISTDKACAPDSRTNDNFACFLPNGTTYAGFPRATGAGTISGGFTPSTMRVMASFERLFGSIGLQARLGFAFNGGQQPKGGTAFFPLHAEARVKWWVLGTSQFSKKGLRPWLHLGGGMAQIDAVVKDVEIADCGSNTTTTTAQSFPFSQECMTSRTPVRSSPIPARTPNPAGGYTGPDALKRSVTAQKQLGTSFIAIGGGVMFAIGPNHGPVLNLNFMLPVPSVGFVIEPSLGYEIGF